MKYSRPALVLALALVSAKPTFADDKPKVSVVDSGSFGIVVKGTRVATETFRIEQRGQSSFIVSEIKTDDATQATQTAELELAPNGTLKKYTWRETKPGDASLTVEPQDEQFLTLRIAETSAAPPKVTTHALSPSTSIIDDNFFSQMEVLAWKYMALGCRPGPNGVNECIWNELKLPTLNPHQQEPLLIAMTYVGEVKRNLKGTEHLFKTFKLTGESGEWSLWFNSENKLVRVVIAAENTEVLRD
ncbi:MAG TPA: hypothetical protein VMZ25_05945 [Terriglobales bacterium]|nr:hypothetical protein [Terriglobales bacterium]